MPSPPYAKVLVSVNGAANVSGGITAPSAATVQLAAESTVAWVAQRWELYDFPAGFTAPAGWSTDVVTGVIFSTAVTPPIFSLPAAATRWGKWMVRLTVNYGIDEFGVYRPVGGDGLPKMVDDTTAIETLSATKGLHDLGALEKAQFGGSQKLWVKHHQENLRILEAFAGGGGGGGTPTGTGFYHVTGGVMDAASKKVDLAASADVMNILAVANGGLGFAGPLIGDVGKAVVATGAGVLAMAALALGLAGAVSGTLPVANGGTGATAVGGANTLAYSNGTVLSYVAAGGDVTGPPSAFVVGKLNGVTVPTGSGNTIGNALRITTAGVGGVAAWSALNLAGGAGFVSGILPVANMPFGAANTVLATNSGGTASAFSLIVNANVDAAAAIAGSKISPLFGAQAVQGASFDRASAAALTIGGANATSVITSIAGTTKLTVAASLTTSVNDIAIGAGTMSTAGAIRLPYLLASTLVGMKNSVGTDMKVISTHASVGNFLQFGDEVVTAQLDIKANGLVVLTGAAGSGTVFFHGSTRAAGFEGSNFAIAQNAGGSYGGGVGVFFMLNAPTAPTTNPSGGGITYVEAGAGKYRGSSGTVTTFGPAEPHCPHCQRDYTTEWKNDAKGEHFAICFPCMRDALEAKGVDPGDFMIFDKLKRAA